MGRGGGREIAGEKVSFQPVEELTSILKLFLTWLPKAERFPGMWELPCQDGTALGKPGWLTILLNCASLLEPIVGPILWAFLANSGFREVMLVI
jgi:hypothetical protein